MKLKGSCARPTEFWIPFCKGYRGDGHFNFSNVWVSGVVSGPVAVAGVGESRVNFCVYEWIEPTWRHIYRRYFTSSYTMCPDKIKHNNFYYTLYKTLCRLLLYYCNQWNWLSSNYILHNVKIYIFLLVLILYKYLYFLSFTCVTWFILR